MSRGVAQSLLEAVLVGSFRPDRMGRLLLGARLPERLPISGGEAAERAWAELTAAQRRYQATGVVDPWGFSVLVRRLHGALRETAASEPARRAALRLALRLGPLASDLAAGRPGVFAFSAGEMAEAWEEWARDESSPADWGFHRFERQLETTEAKEAARVARARSSGFARPSR